MDTTRNTSHQDYELEAKNDSNLVSSGHTKKTNIFKNVDDLEIYKAVINGDKSFFYLLSGNKKLILDFKYQSGNCFHLAVKHYQKEICLILVNIYGFNPREECALGLSALHWIFLKDPRNLSKKEIEKKKFLELIDFLILRQVNVNSKDQNGQTPLHYAAIRNNELGMERMFKHSSKLILNRADNFGLTPFHYACKYGNEQVFHQFLNNANFQLEHMTDESFDFLPLHLVCKIDKEKPLIVEKMLEKILELKLIKSIPNLSTIENKTIITEKLMPIILNRDGASDIAEQLKKLDLDEISVKKGVLIKVMNETWRYLREIINSIDKYEQRAINLAIEKNNFKIVEVLLSYGADVSLCSAGKNLPIHTAAKTGSVHIFEMLKKFNALSLFRHNERMENIFHIAAGNNNFSFLKKCFEQKEASAQFEKKLQQALELVNDNFYTPLYKAISKQSLDCVRFLVENGRVNLRYTDPSERNLFHICAIYDSYECFKYLFEYDQAEFSNLIELNEPALAEKDIDTASQSTLKKSLVEELLYEQDVHMNSILHLAALHKSHSFFSQAVQMILDSKISRSLLKLKNKHGETSFHVACKSSALDIIQLFSSFADFYDPLKDLDDELNTPLFTAVIHNNIQVVHWLTRRGININFENDNKQTALHLSCMHGNFEISQFLIKNGAYLNAYDSFNFNPLVYACQNGKVELVEYLLKIDHSLINPGCLHEAVNNNHSKIVDLLLSHSNWKKCLKQNNEPDYKNLIEKMPDKMELILEKCFDAKGLRYDFSLIDLPILKTFKKHPLYLIAKSKDERLLTHPTTQKIINLKFSSLPRTAYFVDLILYILFALFVSVYHLISARKFEKTSVLFKHDSDKAKLVWLKNSTVFNDENLVLILRNLSIEFSIETNLTEFNYFVSEEVRVSWLVYYLVYVVLFLLVSIHLGKEVFQMISYTPRDYFSSIDNWFQLSALLFTLISLLPMVKPNVRISCGSFAILYAWISLSLFFQELEVMNLGRYIVAFRKTIQNSIKFMPFFLMICMGFFFSFKVGEKMSLLEGNRVMSKTSSWSYFIRIITMMVGQLDMDSLNIQTNESYFQLKNLYKTLVLIFFIFMMCIIVLSLFEGIAVGEIRIVLDKAHIEIISSNIVYILRVQFISYKICRQLFKNREPTFMNLDKFEMGDARSDAFRKRIDRLKKMHNCVQAISLSVRNLTEQLNESMAQLRQIKSKIKKQK